MYVSGGDGSTSEGEFFEGLNSACLRKLPILFLIEDNGWAISVPVQFQTAGGSIAKLVANYPGLHVWRSATAAIRLQATRFSSAPRNIAGRGRDRRWCMRRSRVPIRIRFPTTKSFTRRTRCAKKRRIATPFPSSDYFWCAKGSSMKRNWRPSKRKWTREVREATDQALAAEPPAKESILVNQYSPDVDPTSSRFESAPQFSGEPRTMVEMVSATLADEMARDERIVVLGEDVADCSNEDDLKHVKGKGGVFKATVGLQRRFGYARVFNTPIAEACIVGSALGMAARGLKPVAEIQFFDYIWPAMMQLRNELSLVRWRSNGAFKAPAVIRVATGGYLTGGAIYHSQSGEVLFTHTPGIRVVMPSTALDLCGLLRTAIRCDDPVLFLEHKHLYRQPYNRSPYPGPDLHDSVRPRARRAGRHRRQHHHLRRRRSSRRSRRGATRTRRHFRGNYRSSLALAI